MFERIMRARADTIRKKECRALKRDFECVILAGGKGERLKPLTDTRPKPLCRVGGLSCLEKCVLEARKASPCRITVSACFMAEQITEECRRLGVFSHVDETPAGTAGACRRCAGARQDGARPERRRLVRF